MNIFINTAACLSRMINALEQELADMNMKARALAVKAAEQKGKASLYLEQQERLRR